MQRSILTKSILTGGLVFQVLFMVQRITENMSVIFILIGVSLLVALGFLGAFLWAASSGQYDDDETPAVRMLFDQHPSSKSKSNAKSNQEK